jgi:hypothetical protein
MEHSDQGVPELLCPDRAAAPVIAPDGGVGWASVGSPTQQRLIVRPPGEQLLWT